MKAASHLPLLLAACVLAPATSLALQAEPSAPAIAPFAARQVAPGVHLLGTPADYAGPAISNVSIIEQADGFVLVDSGATLAHGNAVVAYVRSISRKPVKALLFTHWHTLWPRNSAAEQRRSRGDCANSPCPIRPACWCGLVGRGERFGNCG